MDMKELVGNVLRLNRKDSTGGVAYRYLLSHGKHDVVKVKQDKIMIPYASIYKEARGGEGD